MKRRKFVKKAAALPIVGAAAITQTYATKKNQTSPTEDTNEIFEFRQYQMLHGRPQKTLEDYLKDVLIPALNRQGVTKVGVFKEMGMSTPPKLYVLIAHPDFESLHMASAKLSEDKTYQSASRKFESKSSKETVYGRYDTWIFRAFDGMKKLGVTDTASDRIFELRTYEGHNDDAVTRKTAMFDNEEIELFYKVKLNPVFFGKMVAGPAMPALTYMLVFKDMAERDSNWKDFVSHPDWNKMKVKPEYADSVSNIIRTFLKPTAYSQV